MPDSAAARGPRLFRPRTVEAAVAHLSADSCILAGGTIVANHVFVRGLCSSVVDIGDVGELQGVQRAGRGLRMGALYAVADLAQLALDGAAALSDVGLVFSNPQVGRLATVGGNIAWSDGPGDALVALIALDAQVEIADPDGRATAPAEETRDRLCARPGLVTAIDIAPAAETQSAFAKFAPRHASTPAIASVAAAATREAGHLRRVRVALGGAGLPPRRCPAAELCLEQAVAADALLAAAADAVAGSVAAPFDTRYSIAYRQSVAHAVAYRALKSLLARL
jgi:aerobic carbon-monoxide dehydrogenase medium subunit